MEAELYKAAIRGSFQEVSRISNWKEQQTPTKNNILHLHVGKPLAKHNSTQCNPMVYTDFIEKVLDDDEGYLLLWKENDKGDTPLHLAARFGHKMATQVLLERAERVNHEERKKLLKATNNKGDTALHDAARLGHDQVVMLLLEVDDPNCSHHEHNVTCETPLYLAAERGSTPSVCSILGSCSPSFLAYKGPCGRTVLHAAVQSGDSEMVSKILEKDRSLMRTQNDEGLTPLHCVAAEIHKVQLLKVLLHDDKHGDEPSAMYIKDKMGRTPLHIAILRKNWKAMKRLIDCCPDCIEIVDDEGQNVLHYAAKWTCLDVMKQLLRLQHVDKLINDKDNKGNTPLHILAASIPQTPNLHDCLNDLPLFVEENPFVDLKAFNDQNQTVGDVLILSDHLLRKERILRKSCKEIARGRRINEYERDVDVEKATLAGFGETRDSKSLKEAAQTRLVVATLIATVSFTAGFTVPGGFDQNEGKNMGMAVFKDRPLFYVFLVSDMIAFSTSTIAILLYFVLVLKVKKKVIRVLSMSAFIFNTISSGAMMIAFLAGLSLVSSKSLSGLIISISSIFLVVYGILMVRTYKSLLSYSRGVSGKYIMNHRLLG